MNSADYVDQLIKELKAGGMPLQDVAWEAALACEGWPYVFGARGQYCTPANRRARYSDAHPTIKTKCKNFDGDSTCDGCKWYPKGQRTRCFDCRGFPYWILKSVYNGWELMGAGATSQWNTASNWSAKGTIDSMPRNTLCCLFVKKGDKMEHTGFGFNDETCECSNGVQYFKSRNKKWTHWGVPTVVSGSVPVPTPGDEHPTIRRGSTGPAVVECQNDLIMLGYDVGATGADGKYGAKTEAAVKAFQKDHPPLKADGICGPATWSALTKAVDDLVPPEPEPEPAETLYTVTIPHLTGEQAAALMTQYPAAIMTEE